MTDSRVDRLLPTLKNNPVVAILMVVGVIIIGLSQFVDSAAKLASWFPDGALQASEKSRSQTLYSGQAGAFLIEYFVPGGPARLRGYDPAWSHDGSTLAFVQRNYGGSLRLGSDVMLSTDDARSARKLYSSADFIIQPTFSPDQRFVAFIECTRPGLWGYTDRSNDADCRLTAMEIETGDMRSFESDAMLLYNSGDVSSFDWAPDSRHIAFARQQFGYFGQSDTGVFANTLYSGDVLTGEEEALFTLSAEPSSSDSYHVIRQPRWSPDGRSIVVLYGSGEFAVYTYDLTDGATRVLPGLAAHSSAVWSDGNKVAIDTSGASTHAIESYDTASGRLTQITEKSEFLAPLAIGTGATLMYADAKFDQAGRPALRYLKASPGVEEAEPVLSIKSLPGQSGFPIAQTFEDAEGASEGGWPAIPSTMRVSANGNRFAIAIDGVMYLGRLD